MPIYETFAKRKQNSERDGKPVIFRRDELPAGFRVQVVRILDSVVGEPRAARDPLVYQLRLQFWEAVHEILAHEMGVFDLWPGANTKMESCRQFLLNRSDVDDVLSLVELAFGGIQANQFSGLSDQQPHEAIDELNHRFREHGIGYQFEGGQIISVESQYLHTEAVEPAISLLHDARFAGPMQEFLQAHEYYRNGENTQAIANAQYAFESTMKAICDQRGWDCGTERATASRLVDVVFKYELVPAEMQSHFTALRSTLQSGLPTVRNQPGQGGHGQGSDVVDVPDYLAAYCLHLAATNIVFLIEAHNATK